MKKEKFFLTIMELGMIKGGDAYNVNGNPTCICTYADTGFTSNENTISGCRCECVLPK